jgi:maltose-binding protein MalE
VAAVGIALALILSGDIGKSEATPTRPPESPMAGAVQEFPSDDAQPTVVPTQPQADYLEFTIGVNELDIPWAEQMLDRYSATTGIELNYTIYCVSPSELVTYTDAGDLPDLFIYDTDTSPRLHDMGMLAPIDDWTIRVEGVMASQKLYDVSLGMDGHHYGITMSGTTWFLYYNADIFPNTNSILEMINYGHLAFPITNGWFTGAFFADHGNAFYGGNGIDRSRYDLSTTGVAGMECLETLVGHPNVYLLDGEGGHWAILDGRADAYVGGIWDVDDAAEAFEAVGGTMAMCPMPDISAEYPIGLSPFANYQLMGLNADRTGDLMLMDVMYFLCSGESLELRYEITGAVPCYPELVTDSTIYGQADRVNAETLYTIACPQSGYMPEDYWSFMQNLGYDFMNDKVHPEDYEYYATMLEDILYG